LRFLYGVNPVLEALRAHPEQVGRVLLERGRDGRRSQGAERVAQAAAQAKVRTEDAPPGDLDRRSNRGVHQGVGAELADFAYVELPDLIDAAKASGRPAFLLVLDGVTDPQNLGALVRSAHALGAHGVVVPKDRSAAVTPSAAKAAAGALEHCRIARVTNLSRALDELKEAGIWTVALAADGERLLGAVDLSSPRSRSSWEARGRASVPWSARPAITWPASRWRASWARSTSARPAPSRSTKSCGSAAIAEGGPAIWQGQIQDLPSLTSRTSSSRTLRP